MAASRRLWSSDWIPILLGQGFGLLCGLVGVKLLSSWIPPAVLGDYGLFLAFTPVGPLLTHAGLAKHATRHWGTAGNRPAYVRTLLRASVAPTAWLVVALSALATVGAVAHWRATTPALLPWLWLANTAGAYALIFQSSLQGAGCYWADFAITVVSSATRTFLPLLAVFVAGATTAVLAGGFGLHTAIVAVSGGLVVGYLSLARREGTTAATDWNDYHGAFALAGALTLLNSGLNRWIGARLFDEHTLGLFTLAINLAAVLPSVLSAACWQFFFPRLVALSERGDQAGLERYLGRVTALFLGVAALAASALALILPWLPGRLIDPRYAGALPFVLPLFAHGVALGVAYFCQGALLIVQAPRRAFQVAFAATLLLTVGGVGGALLGPAVFAQWLAVSPLVLTVGLGLYTRRMLRLAVRS